MEKFTMKTYSTPKLTVHGNVEAITQAFGKSPVADRVFFGGSTVTTIGPSTGSVDGIIKPV
jgi:hypothetical protein